MHEFCLTQKEGADTNVRNKRAVRDRLSRDPARKIPASCQCGGRREHGGGRSRDTGERGLAEREGLERIMLQADFI